LESDARYYRRRAGEELLAADRAVTEAARERRLQLVGLYLDKLRALDEPLLMAERELLRRCAPQPSGWQVPTLESQVA
jgi:hypothetical protein